MVPFLVAVRSGDVVIFACFGLDIEVFFGVVSDVFGVCCFSVPSCGECLGLPYVLLAKT